MDESKQNTSAYQENKQFMSRSYKTKNDFADKYRKLYKEQKKAKELYLQILTELEQTIVLGNVNSFKNLSGIICYISNLENQETLKTYYTNVNNPIRSTNLVILACKYNKAEILKYIFDNGEILNSLSLNIKEDAISPKDEDDTCHNAFYYAVRSGNVELLDTLMNKWPGNYFDIHFGELDEILSRAYEELKIKNVLLSDETEIFVQNKLINLRFFADDSKEVKNVSASSNIKQRIELILENIKLLNSNLEVDERFLFVVICIAQNIHITKRQLKTTYERLPWEEIEFCLISFVSSHIKHQGINLFYRATLNKGRILNHLQNFAIKLEEEKDNIDSMNTKKLANLPNLKREEIIAKIIDNNPQFEELYNDYQQIRDVSSLEKISNCIKVALTADPKEREGQIIIVRTLQVIGEHLKNTLESPKLSNITSELLLLSLPKNTREVIKDLRNSLSHSYSLSRRTEIQENTDVNFFTGIQNDTKKIESVIADIFYNKKINTIRTLLQKIIQSENLDEIKEVGEALNNVELDDTIFVNFTMMEHEKLEMLIKELSNSVTEKTSYEDELFKKINNVINFEKTKLENFRTDYVLGLAMLKSLDIVLRYNKIDNNIIRGIKFSSNKALENITPKIQPHTLKDIADLSRKILLSVSLRIQNDFLDEIRRITFEIFQIIEFGIGNIKWIEELREKLNENGSSISDRKQKICSVPEEKCNKQLTLKVSELKSILSNNVLSNKLPENYLLYKSDKKLQAVIEMLVLDIMSLLGTPKDYLTNNLFFLDDNTPLLTGKCLRNHLAHDNALIDVLLFDPSIAVILNAKKLTAVNMIKNKKKIGKLVADEPSKLKNKNDHALVTIHNQQKMFVALEEGNLDGLKNCLKKGADINARSLNLWTTLHFAAKGPSLEVVKFILEQNVSLDVKDINGQSPLHIAAAYGRRNIVEFFIDKVGVGVDIKNYIGETPLHVAAENGHEDTVIVVLKYKANTITKSHAGNSPLHDALKNNHIDVVKVLLKKDANVDINETMGGYTALHVAADRGYLELVIFLLQNKADVNAKTDRHYTPLHAAAFNGFPEVVKVLISKGAKVNARIIDGCSPLHYAVENGHEDIVDVLLKHDINVNVADKTYNNTPLHYAAKDGHEGIAKSLLKYKANASAATVEGMTPLHFAVQSGHLGIVIALLDHGVDINAQNINNTTPLHYAAVRGHTEIADLLIKNKAELNATDNNNCTPLYAAAQEGHKDIIDLLIKNKVEINVGANISKTPLQVAPKKELNARDNKNVTPLYADALEGHKDIIDLFIKNKLDINISANNSDTPLHVATKKDVIDLLIKNKADVNARNYVGLTPLHSAAIKDCLDAIVVLIENGAEVNAKTIWGLTPLHAAIQEGHKDVVNLLIKNKAQINARDIADRTPLHLAVEAGCKDVVEILVANGANINAKNKVNQTPLSSAVKHNNKEIVEFLIANRANVDDDDSFTAVLTGYRDIAEILLKHNADINKKDVENTTLLHLAAIRGDKGIVNSLISKGADVNAKAINDATPLYVAAEKGHEKIAEILISNGAHINAINIEGTALHIAAGRGHKNVVEVLLSNGANINIKDKKNRTSLQLAIANGHLQVVKTLLHDKNVDVNAKGNDDWTLLHIAAQAGNVELTKCLVDHRANINAKNSSGSKPIHIAAREGYKKIVEFYLMKGLSINDRGAVNQTLLHYAALGNQLEVAEYLIEQGIDVNTKDLKGLTPIHIAASCGSKIVTEFLLNSAIYNPVDIFNRTPLQIAKDKFIINLLTSTEKLFEAVKHNSSSDVKKYIKAKAFVNAKNSDSGTPLHYAAWKGYDEVVDILLQNKGNPNAVNNKGFTPLHYASKFSHLKIVKALLSNGAIYNAVSDTGKTPLDIAEDKSLVNLLQLVNESFKNIVKCNSKVINDLKKIKDTDTVKAVMNARNRENKTLVVIAMCNDFPKIEQLKQILQDDVSAYIVRAEELLIHEKYQDALILYRKVLDKRREILGPDNPGTLDIQDRIAVILYKQQNYQEAFNMFEEIYQKQKEILGINSIDTLKTRSSIALVLHRQGKNEEALNIYKEVYQNQKEILEIDHSDILDTQAHMALVLDRLKKYEEALSVNYDVFEKRKKKFGINHPMTLVTKNNIAMVLNNQGKHDEAVQLYRQVYEARKIILGPGHSDTLRALHNMIAVLSRQQNYDEALKAYKEVFETQKKYLGPNHIDTLNTQFNIANLHFSQGKFIGALKYYKESFEQRKAILGPNHSDILNTLKMIEVINLRFKFEGSGASEMLQHLQKDINIAASNGDVQTVQRLLEEGADANDKDVDGRTPIHYAISNEQISIINVLLKNGADVTQATNKGNTPLHTATSKGCKEIVEILLKHVSRNRLNDFINAQTIVGGATSLHVAAKNGYLEIVKFLLKSGAIYNIKNKDNQTPLNVSNDQNISNLFKLIEKLFEDAKNGNVEVIRKLKLIKSDELTIVTNTRNNQGNTLLQIAITNKHKNIANELLKMLKMSE